MGRSVASCELRAASHADAERLRPPYSLQPTAYSLSGASRRGISLLEVLISMFVLLFGLMGVAAIFPVGNHFAGKGEQYDRGAALADQAFADIKARGFLKPSAWMYPELPTSGLTGPAGVQADGATDTTYYHVILPTTANAGSFNIQVNTSTGTTTGSSGPGHAFVVDPLGIAAALDLTPQSRGIDVFPLALCNEAISDGVQTNGNGDPIATNLRNPDEWGGSAVPTTLRLIGKRWPIRRVTLADSSGASPMLRPVAESICSLRDDLANETPDQDDRPGSTRWSMQIVGAPDKADADPTDAIPEDDIPLARTFAGNYSWIATVTPTALSPALTVSGNPPTGVNAMQSNHSEYSSRLYDVSVAVFHKRDVLPSAASERAIAASLNIGGELVIHAADNANGVAAVDNAVKDLFPGQWVAVAGVHPTSGVFLLKWYKLLSLDDETVENELISPALTGTTYSLRLAMVEGPDWPAPVGGGGTVTDLRAIILPGVIGVSTQSLPMERE